MFSLNDIGQIRLSRGDTLTLPIYINQGTSMDRIIYTLADNDELYFAIMEPNQPWEQAIVKKKYTCKDNTEDSGILLMINPEDTMCLLPGLYYYQIKVRVFDLDRNTYIVNSIIPKTQFWIEE